MLLDEPGGVASILEKLLRSKNKDRALVAFQIAFDLVENEDQTFLLYVRDLFSMCQPSDSTQNDHATDPREGMYAERSYLLIPKTIKQPIEKSGSVCHNATLYANAIMHAGTAVGTFVRENLDLLRKRGNWAQFSAIAGLGVIYRDNREQLQLQQGESQMSPYVFESPSGVSCIAYTKGGALCAVDLYYANHGEEIKQCIRDSLRGTNVEVVQHGACLGLGLAALGTAGENIYDDIKNVLHADSAVAGEAAGLQAIYLLVLVRHNMRRLLALTVYGREEEADTN
uniref:RPN1 N-terminal domain-containing protein n=1 Tax=Populus trichocarpa TaxID=3694 RepID=A0A3N7ETZ0_POPTR